MAERVVELLEVVEVDQQQGGGAVLRLGRGDRRVEAAVELAAVGEAGEVVRDRLAPRGGQRVHLAEAQPQPRGGGDDRARPRARWRAPGRCSGEAATRTPRATTTKAMGTTSTRVPSQRPAPPIANEAGGSHAATRDEREGDEPARVEQRAGLVAADGQPVEVDRVGEREHDEREAEDLPAAPGPPAGEGAHADDAHEQQQVGHRVGEVGDDRGDAALRRGRDRGDEHADDDRADGEHADQPVQPHARVRAAQLEAEEQHQPGVDGGIAPQPAQVGPARERRRGERVEDDAVVHAAGGEASTPAANASHAARCSRMTTARSTQSPATAASPIATSP